MRCYQPIRRFLILLLPAAAPGGFPDSASADEPRGVSYQYRSGAVVIPAASAGEPKKPVFSQIRAREYLDLGASLWAEQKECISCHTHGVYLQTRPALSKYWGNPPAGTREFLVAQTEELIQSGDTTRSTSTKTAYLARGLAAWDAEFSESASPETDAALRHLLTAFQADDGSIEGRNSWPPLNADTWHGTTMAALAIAEAPAWLAAAGDGGALPGKVEKLKSFLRDADPKHDHHRLLVLWASTRFEDLIGPERKERIIGRIRKLQRPDGGWSIRNFATADSWGGGKRSEKLLADPDYHNPPSDGYQTGLVIVVLRDAGIPGDDPAIQRGVRWLLENQRESGRWWTRSLNTESRFHYITYSGSAYAALALAKCGKLEIGKPE